MKIKEENYYRKLFITNFPPLSLIFSRPFVIIFGAGRLGQSFANSLEQKKVKVAAFVDNNKQLIGKFINNIPVVSLETAKKKYRKHPVIIASALYGNEINNLLKKNKFSLIYPTYFLNTADPILFDTPGFNGVFKSLFNAANKKKINAVINILADQKSKDVFEKIIQFRLIAGSQYIKTIQSNIKIFEEKNVFPLSNSEIYVDAGAYDGDTIKQFGMATSWKFDHIYAFEPDRLNHQKLVNWASKTKYNDKINSLNVGLYSKTGSVSFDANGTVDSKISKNKASANKIKVISLDNFFKNKRPPTLIKMDIEGAEIPALNGAENIIRKYKPKLAISIYHNPADLWKIIFLIKSFNNQYQFYIRHLTGEFADTVCFAI